MNLPLLDRRVAHKAEFDFLADEYGRQHRKNIAISGEGPEYFAEYKIADLADLVRSRGLIAAGIFDLGCGIGNTVPYFRRYFPHGTLTCGDVSARSIEIAKARFPGDERYVLIGEDIALPAHSQDVVFSACAFHHISPEAHAHWLAELCRITRPGGLLVIFEHNPLNPLTVHAVNTCPFDVNARLIHAAVMRRRALNSGWRRPEIDYKLFFPAMARALRPFEKHLAWLPLGAQYRLAAHCPD